MRPVIALLPYLALPLLLSACDRTSTGDGQGDASGNAAANAAVTSGEVAPEAAPALPPASGKIDRSKAGTPSPDFTFSGPDGADVTMADFEGRPVLVNLWATWCGPCIVEMPTLDTIAGDYAKAGLVVLPISQDAGEAASVDSFFKARKLKHLQLYRDPENQFGFHYATGLLPTTVLYDAEGKEVARVVGAMDWAGEDARALIDGVAE